MDLLAYMGRFKGWILLGALALCGCDGLSGSDGSTDSSSTDDGTGDDSGGDDETELIILAQSGERISATTSASIRETSEKQEDETESE
jgi:hypothetical protein